MTPEIVILDTCASTNSVLNDMVDAPHCTIVATRAQTAGRGQRGNSWEAEPGKNLTFSMLFRPGSLHATRQFELSMIVSLAITDAIDTLLPPESHTSIKWPNDIYIGAEKVCGILIENKLAGACIERAIAGVGINVNQTVFLSDAPNPTSIILHNGGRETDLDTFLHTVTDLMASYVDTYFANPNPETLKGAYMRRLMRTSGDHLFRDAEGTFSARIVDVAPDGMLHLSNGRSYAFKEVAYII